MVGSTAAVTGWVEKRLRDAKDYAEACVKERAEQHVKKMDEMTSEYRLATARLERQTAMVTRDLADHRLGQARELRELVSREELRNVVTEKFDQLEQRLEDLLPQRNGNGK